MSVQRVAIVDYGMCNLDSVRHAFEEVGAKAFVTAEPADLDRADRIVLPGVGAFPDAMRNLRARGSTTHSPSRCSTRAHPSSVSVSACSCSPQSGTRSPTPPGSVGSTRRSCASRRPSRTAACRTSDGTRCTDSLTHRCSTRSHPGRTSTSCTRSTLRARDPADVLATTPYCGGFTSVVQRGHVYGVQFHPEKSQRWGLRLLQNFLTV